MKPWPRTLGMQLIVVTVGALLLTNFAVVMWFEWGRERHNESEMIERMLERTASVATLMESIPPKARAAAAEAMGSRVWHFKVVPGNAVTQPMNPEEAVLSARLQTMLPAETAQFPVNVRFRIQQPGEEWEHHHHGPPHGRPVTEMTLPIASDTQLVAIFVRPPPPPWSSGVVITAIVAVIISSALAAYVSRWVARPLSKLAASALVVARGGTALRVPEVGSDDVRNAARAFNAMTDQVTRTLESQRQLLSAVGHDLRTPLTAMRINLEFIQDAELRERLEKNLDELQDLTEAVLSAGRGAGGEIRRQVDLAALVESLCADLDDMGEPVSWKGHAPAPLFCRPNEVRRAVRNLIENAVAYGKRAEVAILDAPDAYEIVVEDEGHGIPEADRGRVFEPFVRLEGSRSQDTGGAGLGLTLVKAIAEGHGGEVILENRAEDGLRARMKLPRGADGDSQARQPDRQGGQG